MIVIAKNNIHMKKKNRKDIPYKKNIKKLLEFLKQKEKKQLEKDGNKST